MSVVKSIESLDFLSQEAISTIEQRALLHRRYSNIEFKILDYGLSVVIRITQGKSPSGNQFTNKQLHQICLELFDGIAMPDSIKINPRPIPYQTTPADVVNSEWIKDAFEKSEVSLKQAAMDTGIDATSLSAFRAGKKPISGVTRAALYYYFKSLEPK